MHICITLERLQIQILALTNFSKDVNVVMYYIKLIICSAKKLLTATRSNTVLKELELEVGYGLNFANVSPLGGGLYRENIQARRVLSLRFVPSERMLQENPRTHIYLYGPYKANAGCLDPTAIYNSELNSNNRGIFRNIFSEF